MTDRFLRSLASLDGPRALPGLEFPSACSILYLAPHPDDFDVVAVTLRWLARNGNPLAAGVVRTGSGVEDSYQPGLTLAGKADLREREQRRSLAFFGLPPHHLTFLSLVNDADDQALDCAENRDAVAAFVEQTAPDIVFVPHPNDANHGHQAVHSLLTQIARRSGRPLAALLCCDPKTIDLRIDLYTPFEQEDADWKAELLRFHDTQHQRNLRTRGSGLDDRILGANRALAERLSLDSPYAEAFEVELFDVA